LSGAYAVEGRALFLLALCRVPDQRIHDRVVWSKHVEGFAEELAVLLPSRYPAVAIGFVPCDRRPALGDGRLVPSSVTARLPRTRTTLRFNPCKATVISLGSGRRTAGAVRQPIDERPDVIFHTFRIDQVEVTGPGLGHE